MYKDVCIYKVLCTNLYLQSLICTSTDNSNSICTEWAFYSVLFMFITPCFICDKRKEMKLLFFPQVWSSQKMFYKYLYYYGKQFYCLFVYLNLIVQTSESHPHNLHLYHVWNTFSYARIFLVSVFLISSGGNQILGCFSHETLGLFKTHTDTQTHPSICMSFHCPAF